MNLSPEKMDILLKMAGKKLGKKPEDLKEQLEGGNLNDVLGRLPQSAQDKFGALMNDPKALETMLQNDKVKSMLAGLMGRK